MVSTLDTRLTVLDLIFDQVLVFSFSLKVLVSYKTWYSHSASFHAGTKMGTSKLLGHSEDRLGGSLH